MKTFLVLTMRNANFDAGMIPSHRAFLAALRDEGRIKLAGPFTDGSGAAYLLRAETPDEASRIALSDPLHTQGVSTVTVREWDAM